MIQSLNIKIIRIDGGTQSRVKIDESTVSEYADSIESGSEFPPVTVFFDGTDTYLADGFHRYFAHLKAGKASIRADVINGTLRDAILHSVNANHSHGLRRTNDDKRKSVLTLLNDFEWGEEPDTWIARQCHVSAPFVKHMRESMGKEKSDTIKVRTPDGKVHERKPTREVKVEKRELPTEKPQAPEEFKHDENDEMIKTLITENERLTKELAIGAAPDPQAAKTLIEELQEELRIAKIELVAVKKSRDMYQAEAAQLKKQVAMMRKKMKEAGID